MAFGIPFWEQYTEWDGARCQAEPTGLPEPASPEARDDWKPLPRTPFHDGSLSGDDGLRRVLEMVAAAARD